MPFELFELRRPQYPPSPEILLSALAWSLVERAKGTEHQGLIYLRHGRVRRGVSITSTFPQKETLEAYRQALVAAGVRDANGDLSLDEARACALALKGMAVEKSAGTATSAIGVGVALMQDPIGGLAVANPPNFAHLFNTMYVLGGGVGQTAAERWYEAAKQYSHERRLAAIEQPLVQCVLAKFIEGGVSQLSNPRPSRSSIPPVAPEWWRREVIDAGIGTPFSWFRTSWDRLCSPEWYEVLPARRWTSWALCTLRTALGFTFLWEAHFFSELARGALERDRAESHVVQRALCPPNPLIPYQRGSISQMDVMPAIKRMLAQGQACRKAIEAALQKERQVFASLAEFVAWLRQSSREGLEQALGGGGDTSGSQNLEETVRYALLQRGADSTADQNGLLRVVSKRFTHVAPGAEWIVVMSALSTPGPTHVLRLGDVQASLEALGFKPRIDFLLGELEKAGLCATASDGDEGIEIDLEFGAN